MSIHKSAFSVRLKELRIQQNLSQYKLADLLHLSRSMISNYEQAIREPDYNTLILFADYFEVTTDYLLGYSNIKQPILSKEQKLHFSGLLKEIDSIEDCTIDNITYLLNLSKRYNGILKQLESLSQKSIDDLEKYIYLLKTRDEAEK